MRAGKLFPPQVRDWGLPAEVLLTPHAARRVARDSALQTFDKAGAALGEDWGRILDGKQIQRWAEALGRTMVQKREAQVRALEQGHHPASPANAPTLLVIGLDRGRVQMREETGKKGPPSADWREDKIGTFTTYLPGDGTKSGPPKPLVRTYVATMQGTEGFGKMVRVEAERRGLSRSKMTLAMGDGGHWIDPLIDRERL